MSSYTGPSADAVPGPTRSAAADGAPPAPSQGTGWIVFSGVMLVIAGLLNLVDGLWAIDASNSSAITDEVESLLWYSDSLELWGWIYTILGAALVVVGIGVFTRSQWARWIGIAAASVSMAVNMMWVFVYPIPALIHFLVATTVLYALTVYGGDEYETYPMYDTEPGVPAAPRAGRA